MSKITLPQGQDNIIMRNQEAYGFLPKDVIDRLGNTALQLLTEDQTALGAINEIKSNLTDLEYTLVDAKYGNVAMDLPANWKELVIYFRYGNSNGLQSQVIQGGLLRIHANSSFAYAVGSGTIAAQFTVNTNDNTITMTYFAVGTTAYTTTSQMTVYARS